MTLEHGIDWSAHQDPRTRLLWDKLSGTRERIFIIGDSEFCSFYVRSEAETIWKQLESLIGEPVFAGALNGANSGDFLDAARFIVQERRGKGGVVLLDLVPTRFLTFVGARPEKSRNYDLGARIQATTWQEFEQRTWDVFFLRRIQIAAILTPREEYFNRGTQCFRVWHKDGNLAEQRYRGFVRHFRPLSDPSLFRWLPELERTCRSGGLELWLVPTPVNVDLINRYSPPSEARQVLSVIRETRAQLEDYAAKAKLRVIPIPFTLPSECFADLFHTNSNGASEVARALAARINRERRRPSMTHGVDGLESATVGQLSRSTDDD